MGEKAKKIGEKLEGFGERLYERFGWTELIKDEEIKCQRSSHRTDENKRLQTHGVDLYHKYYDPYIGKTIGVITECKNYAWKSICPSNMKKWFEQLEWTIECAQMAEELQACNEQCERINTGILLVHANDNQYNDLKFKEYLSNLKYKSKRNATNIFIATNEDINRWDSMFEYIEKNFKNSTDTFNFYYPSILGSKLEKLPHITLYQLFSDYIFAEVQTMEEVPYGSSSAFIPKVKRIVFSFDKITESSFSYICSMFKELQLEGCDEYLFVFYPTLESDVDLVKEKFVKCTSDKLDHNKIKFALLDNRTLSPVDTK